MLEAEAPSSTGQWLIVEDGGGVRWRIECLGEPVAVGARIAFSPIGDSKNERREGELVRVLAAARETWVARVVRGAGTDGLNLIPFSGAEVPELRIVPRDAKGAKPGDRVLVGPRDRKGASGRGEPDGRGRRHWGGAGHHSGIQVKVLEVYGPAGDPTADHRALVWKHRLPLAFSRRTRLEADEIDASLSAAESKHRKDLRHIPFITIDPASAKDHDDAVFAEDRPTQPALRSVTDTAVEGDVAKVNQIGWQRRLWVAIADVSHFVSEGDFLDAEARRRGNSFYFPDRSIPMLPERLSSDLCSLRPDVDRLAIVAELRIGSDGTVVDALFHEGLIRSHARLAYEDAAEWLDTRGAMPASEEDPAWADSLRCLNEIAQGLTQARERAGALTLELPEIELVVDDAGRPIDARVRTRNRAHILIEEAMLAANRAVAHALDRAARPALHRVHPPPSPQKLHDLQKLLERYGVEVQGELETPGVLAAALESVKGLPGAERLHLAALRSMSQARYQSASEGHYALRFEHYLHFTSPIRRYADLEVHRVLRRLMRDEAEPQNDVAKATEHAERVAIWLSGRERVAQEAERDAEALAACALMQSQESELFEAEVTGASEFGLFVRLVSPAVNGLVPIRTMRGRWDLDAENDALIQMGNQSRIAVGDSVRVKLTEIDSDRARLTFALSGGAKRSVGSTRGSPDERDEEKPKRGRRPR